MKKRLQRLFFQGATPDVAKNILGCVLVRETLQGTIAGIVTETEAYTEEDEASHSFAGKRTARNEAMFENAGHMYVYLTYGMYHCMNIVSEGKGRGCAVLIRAIKPIEGIEMMRDNRAGRKDQELTDGPGKVCQALNITKEHNGIDMTTGQSPIYLLESTGPSPAIVATPRIGISKAKETLWRFIMH